MDYKEVNDYELMYMVSDLSDDCVELILEKYRPLIQQLVWKWKPFFKKTGLECEDLEQEIQYAFIVAIRSYDERQNTSLYTHFLNVVNNTMKHIFRIYDSKKYLIFNEAISLSTPFADHIELGDLLTGNEQSVDYRLEESYLHKIIYDFCYTLSIDHAFIFELYMSGFELANMEKLLELESIPLSKIIFRLRQKLKKVLIQNGYLIQESKA